MPVVPPGHRVVIVYPSPRPFFVPSESGPMMLNFGSVEYVPSALTKIAEWAGSAKEQQSVVWLMPGDILPAFDNTPALLAQIADLVAAAPHVSHLAVFPGSSPLLERVMESLRGVGVNTRAAHQMAPVTLLELLAMPRGSLNIMCCCLPTRVLVSNETCAIGELVGQLRCTTGG